jgi:hypothetical protein
LIEEKMFTHPKNQVAVVIPVYKPRMTVSEEISFERCVSVLGNHPIILMAPDGLDLTGYLNAGANISVSSFEPRHFESLQGYDRLMLSKSFYERFLDYQYILIYQLDAFVFSDQLKEWCSKNYDYLGAPWMDLPVIKEIASHSSRVRQLFPNWSKRFNQTVGNGGFSLRKVKSFCRMLALWENKARNWPYYEDTFFAFFVPSYNPFFRIPKFEVALQFAFELNPAKCYSLNHHELPFGCHAWEKHDIEFWRPIFLQFGYAI